jgi:hypothetical protein
MAAGGGSGDGPAAAAAAAAVAEVGVPAVAPLLGVLLGTLGGMSTSLPVLIR